MTRFFHIIAAMLLLIQASCRPIYKERTPEFANSVRSAIEPHELQLWATKLMSSTSNDQFEALDIDLQDVPSSIRNLVHDGSPLQMAFYDQKTKVIYLVWGGGFGHWGILVGSPSLEQPNDDKYYMKWEPGIFFWHETK